MAHHQHRIKRLAQSKKRNERNLQTKARIRTEGKKISTATNTAEAQAYLSAVTSTLDKAAKRGILHKNAVARRVSRLAKRANKIAANQ